MQATGVMQAFFDAVTSNIDSFKNTLRVVFNIYSLHTVINVHYNVMYIQYAYG